MWQVSPFPHAHTAPADKLAVHARLRGLLDRPARRRRCCCRSASGSTRCDVVDRMADGVDLDAPRRRGPTSATPRGDWLAEVPLTGAATTWPPRCPNARRPLARRCCGARRATSAARSASAPARVPAERARAAPPPGPRVETRLAPARPLRPVTAGEICWLYARALRREVGEPASTRCWEPPAAPGRRRRPTSAGARGVLAHLTDAVVKEGGYKRRPGPAPPPPLRAHRRARRHAATRRSWRWPTCPTTSRSPAAAASGCSTPTTSGFPVDWCVRVRRSPTPTPRPRCGASTATSSARSTSTTAR